MGVFHLFLDERSVELVGVEAAGTGLDTGRSSASRARPSRRPVDAPRAGGWARGRTIVFNLSGRGDKDVATVAGREGTRA